MVEKSSTEILNDAITAQADRAKSRDTPEGERSMRRCVEAFNALEGTNLTEAQGWRFMAVLKHARSVFGAFNLDDYVDWSSYASLAGEAAGNETRPPASMAELARWAEEQSRRAFGETAARGYKAPHLGPYIRPEDGPTGLGPEDRRAFRDAPGRGRNGLSDLRMDQALVHFEELVSGEFQHDEDINREQALRDIQWAILHAPRGTPSAGRMREFLDYLCGKLLAWRRGYESVYIDGIECAIEAQRKM